MTLLLIALVAFVAAAFRGVTGFGFALIAALGLGWVMPPTVMVPLVLVVDLSLTALVLVDRRHGAVDWPAARLLLVSGCAGAVVGSALAGGLDEETARLLVAAIVLVAALVALIHEPPRVLASAPLGAGVGFVVGAALAAFAVGGPLVAAWLLAGGCRRDRIRGTLAVFFGVVDAFSLAVWTGLGQIGEGLADHLVRLWPVAVAGYFAGHVVGKRLQPRTWHRVTSGGLLAIAMVGAIRTVQLVLN